MDWVPVVTASIGAIAALMTAFGARRAAKAELTQNEAAVDRLQAARAAERAVHIGELLADGLGVAPTIGEGAGETPAQLPAAPVQAQAQVHPEQRFVENLERRSETRFQIQSAHYSGALRQSTVYFYFSVGVGFLGFILIFTGAALAIAKFLEVGTLSGVAGLLAEAGSALIFNQSSKAKADAQANLTAIAQAAERDENRQMAYIYASKVEDAALRDSTNAELARQYLSLLADTGADLSASGDS